MNIKLFLTLPLLLVSLMLAGCGRSGPTRAPITGNITIGGAPLKGGRILFLPQAPAEGPAASARIADGKYELPDSVGPVVGSNRVEIEADLPISFEIDDEAAFAKTKGKLPPQPIPQKFNRESTLSIVVKADSENRFDLDIPAVAPVRRSVSYR
jgi:hypothetical protein